MNLVIARSCTNTCPYCFEVSEREKGKQNLISAENAVKVAEWARRANLAALSFLGGEPFLHPELGKMVRLFRKISPNTNLRVLTGGVFNKDLLETLSPQDVGLVFNVNEPRDYRNPKHFNKVIRNIELAISRGFNVVLGFNVWRLDFDASFMPGLAARLARTKFCWTVANPIKDHQSNVVSRQEYARLADRCFEMLRIASGYGLEAMLDCPVPPCFFKDSQLGWIAQYHPKTVANLGVCNPIMDITPELEVIRCFALSGMPRTKLADFGSEREIRDWFVKNVDDRLLQGGCFDECAACVHFSACRCYGGCLAWHSQTGDAGEKPLALQLIENMAHALENEKPEVAIECYSNATNWIKTDIAKYSAAVAASELGHWRRVLAFATEADQMTANREMKEELRKLLADLPAEVFDQLSAGDPRLLPYVNCPQPPTADTTPAPPAY